MSSTSEYLSVF